MSPTDETHASMHSVMEDDGTEIEVVIDSHWAVDYGWPEKMRVKLKAGVKVMSIVT